MYIYVISSRRGQGGIKWGEIYCKEHIWSADTVWERVRWRRKWKRKRDRSGEMSTHHPWLLPSAMATITKSQPASLEDNMIPLPSSIPAPFSSSDRDFILRSSHTDSLHHPITSSPIAHEHLQHAQETQVFGKVLLNSDRVSPTTTQVNSLFNLRLCLLWNVQSRTKMSCRQ
jgi:hypothetical protein